MAAYPKNKNNDPAEFEDVYAGPGMMDEIGMDDPEEPETVDEPAPEPEKPPKPDESEFVCVYAGPEYFGIKEEPEIIMEQTPEPETTEDPEPESEPDPEPEPEPEKKNRDVKLPPEAFVNCFDDRSNKPFEGVYAGPQMNQFMAVYAGPQYMMAYAGPNPNPNGGGFIGMMPQQPEPAKNKKCELCGAEMPLTAKFCGKCGSKFKVIKFCPGCGTPVIEGSRFCHECGAVLK